MAVWVTLLRAVNLGARNQVNMPRLREALTDAGFAEVRTYVQSGNVVARSAHRSPERVGEAVCAVVEEYFGVRTSAVVRRPAELREVLEWDPFPDSVAARPAGVQVIHLSGTPNSSAVRELLSTDWGGDQVAARGREIVIAYDATMHASKLQHAAVLRRLGTDGTARNWRTLQNLVALTEL